MHDFTAFLIKLLTIFIGSGIVSLIALFIAQELSQLPQLFFNKYKTSKHGLKLLKQRKLDPNSAFYVLSYNRDKNIKLFSTPNGIKMI